MFVDEVLGREHALPEAAGGRVGHGHRGGPPAQGVDDPPSARSTEGGDFRSWLVATSGTNLLPANFVNFDMELNMEIG